MYSSLKYAFFPFFIFLSFFCYSQNFVVQAPSSDTLVIEFQNEAFTINEVNEYTQIISENGILPNKKGYPALPQFSIPLALAKDYYSIEVQPIDIDTIQLSKPIAPLKGYSTTNSDIILSDVYFSDNKYPASQTKLSASYFIYNTRGQNLTFTPFEYHPSSGKLICYHSAKLIITKQSESQFPQFTTSRESATLFENLSFQPTRLKRSITQEQESLLIITPQEFSERSQSYAEWKTQRNINCYVETIESSTITSNDIENIIRNYYDQHGIEYVILMGDAEQIPPKWEYGDSDVSYGFIEGTDAYSEVMIGRFSASSTEELESQLIKTILYEQNVSNTDPTYVLVASSEGPGDNGEFDYQHMQNMKQSLSNSGFINGDELYDGDRGGNDATGDPSSDDFISSLNQGKDMFLYMGHGTSELLQTTGVSISDTISLTNNTQWPFAMIGGCQVGNFKSQTSFAETFMSAGTINNPLGFSAIVASSVDQLWAPPMYGQDAFIAHLESDKKLSLGKLLQNAFIDLNIAYETEGAKTVSTWNLFGDPTIHLHTETPQTIEFSTANTLPAGTNSFSFSSNIEGVAFSLTQATSTFAQGITTSGNNLAFCNPLLPGVYKLTGYKSNCEYFQTDITIEASNVELVLTKQIDLKGNIIDCSADNIISLTLQNASTKKSENTTVSLSSSSTHTSVNHLSNSVYSVEAGNVLSIDSIASIACHDITADETVIIDVTVSNEHFSNTYSREYRVRTPSYEITETNILDEPTHNNNQAFEAGEAFLLTHTLKNITLLNLPPTQCSIAFTDNISATIENFRSFHDSVVIITRLVIPNNIQFGEEFSIEYKLEHPAYNSSAKYHGEMMSLIEDWETTSSNLLDWNFNTEKQWSKDNSFAYSANNSLKSAPIEHDDTTSFSVEYHSKSNDSISFYVYISTEEPSVFGDFIDYYDFFEFLIDDVSTFKSAGYQNWKRISVPVDSGKHTFTWRYIKDYDTSDGMDAVWVDQISFPPSIDFSNQTPIEIEKIDTLSMAGEEIVFSLKAPSNTTTIHEINTPDWLTIFLQNDSIHFLGQPQDTGLYSFIISYEFTNGYANQKHSWEIFERPPAHLIFTKAVSSEEVLAGDSIAIQLTIKNVGKQNSEIDSIEIWDENLTNKLASTSIEQIKQDSSQIISLSIPTDECLTRDSTIFYSAILRTNQPDTIKGSSLIKSFIPTYEFVSSSILFNNYNSIYNENETFELSANLDTSLIINPENFSGTLSILSNEVPFFYSDLHSPLDTFTVPQLANDSIIYIESNLKYGTCTFSNTDSIIAKANHTHTDSVITLNATLFFDRTVYFNNSFDTAFIIKKPLWIDTITNKHFEGTPNEKGIDSLKILVSQDEELFFLTYMISKKQHKQKPLEVSFTIDNSPNENELLSGEEYSIAITLSNTDSVDYPADTTFISIDENSNTTLIVFDSVKANSNITLVDSIYVKTPSCLTEETEMQLKLNIDSSNTIKTFTIKPNYSTKGQYIFEHTLLNNGDTVLDIGETQKLLWKYSIIGKDNAFDIKSSNKNMSFIESNYDDSVYFMSNEFIVGNEAFSVVANISTDECSFTDSVWFDVNDNSIPEYDSIVVSNASNVCFPESFTLLGIEQDTYFPIDNCLSADSITFNKIAYSNGEQTGFTSIRVDTIPTTSKTILENQSIKITNSHIYIIGPHSNWEVLITDVTGRNVLRTSGDNEKEIEIPRTPSGVLIIQYRSKSESIQEIILR